MVRALLVGLSRLAWSMILAVFAAAVMMAAVLWFGHQLVATLTGGVQ